MTYKEIHDLIKMVNKSKLTEFKMKDGDFMISIRTNQYEQKNDITPVTNITSVPPIISTPITQAPPTQVVETKNSNPSAESSTGNEKTEKSDDKYIEIKSPIVGTFYRSSSPDKPAYVKVGDEIKEGSVVCIVEAMKLFNEIESEVGGKIVKVCVEDASPVEYDQVLFLVDPS